MHRDLAKRFLTKILRGHLIVSLNVQRSVAEILAWRSIIQTLHRDLAERSVQRSYAGMLPRYLLQRLCIDL